GTEYVLGAGGDPAGRVWLQAVRNLAWAGTLLGAEVGVPGLADTGNSYIWLRGQVVEANPTTIRMKAWADGQPEPTAWHYTATDSAAALQSAGTVGLRTFVSSLTSNAPVLFSFDDLQVSGVPAAATTQTSSAVASALGPQP